HVEARQAAEWPGRDETLAEQGVLPLLREEWSLAKRAKLDRAMRLAQVEGVGEEREALEEQIIRAKAALTNELAGHQGKGGDGMNELGLRDFTTEWVLDLTADANGNQINSR
ncbi:hypothetical protein THAOC_26883, partial [Thalassiosira oceanica]